MTPDRLDTFTVADPRLDKWRRYSKQHKPFLKWHPNPRLHQAGIRGRGDTVGINVNTYDYALNTGWTQAVDEVFRWRCLVQETVGDAKTVVVKAQFNLAGAGYTDVTASSAIQWATSGQYADDDSITSPGARLGSGTWVDGYGSETDNIAPDTGSVSLSGNDETEFEFAFTIDSAQVTNGQTFTLRLVESDGTVFFAYDAGTEPNITVNEPPTTATSYVTGRSQHVPPLGAMVDWSHPISRDLEACWPAVAGTGTVLFDVTGHGHNGTINDAANMWSQSPGGPGLVNAGDTTDYVNIPENQDRFRGTMAGLTIMAYCYDLDNTNGTSDGDIISLGGVAGTYTWSLEIQDPNKDIAFYLRTDGGQSTATSTEAYDGASLHIIIGTWDASTSVQTLYIDGVNVGGTVNNGTSVETGDGGDIRWFVNASSSARRSEGTIMMGALWRRGLTEGEVLELVQDPYVMLRPLPEPIWMLPQAAPPGPAAGLRTLALTGVGV